MSKSILYVEVKRTLLKNRLKYSSEDSTTYESWPISQNKKIETCDNEVTN